jgi:hypothetical protein
MKSAALARLTGQTVTLQIWGSLLNELVDQMLAQRKIFLMHERNQAARRMHLSSARSPTLPGH